MNSHRQSRSVTAQLTSRFPPNTPRLLHLLRWDHPASTVRFRSRLLLSFSSIAADSQVPPLAPGNGRKADGSTEQRWRPIRDGVNPIAGPSLSIIFDVLPNLGDAFKSHRLNAIVDHDFEDCGKIEHVVDLTSQSFSLEQLRANERHTFPFNGSKQAPFQTFDKPQFPWQILKMPANVLSNVPLTNVHPYIGIHEVDFSYTIY